MWHVAFFSGSNCSWSWEQFPAPAPRRIHPEKAPALPWGLAGHSQGRLTPGRFIRQVYNSLPLLQPPPSPVTTWTAGFQQHRRSTSLFQSCPVPAPCPRLCLSLPAPALQEPTLAQHGASHSWTAAAGPCPIPCCCQWHFPCSWRWTWCGEGSRCCSWSKSFLLPFMLGMAGAPLLSLVLAGGSPV